MTPYVGLTTWENISWEWLELLQPGLFPAADPSGHPKETQV